MKVTLVMASGKELVFKCQSCEVKPNPTGRGITNLKMSGVEGQMFLHVELENIDAVLYEQEGMEHDT